MPKHAIGLGNGVTEYAAVYWTGNVKIRSHGGHHAYDADGEETGWMSFKHTQIHQNNIGWHLERDASQSYQAENIGRSRIKFQTDILT